MQYLWLGYDLDWIGQMEWWIVEFSFVENIQGSTVTNTDIRAKDTGTL